MSFTVDPNLAHDLNSIRNLKTSQVSNVSNSLTSTHWDDDLFKEIYGEPAKTYLFKKGDTESIGKLCMVFLANYLGLKQNKPEELIGLYKSILPSMTIGKKLVFAETSNTPSEALEIGEVDVNAYKFPGSMINQQVGSCLLTKQHIKTFWTEMTKLNADEGGNRKNLIDLTCFIMLNCLRLIKKEATCLNFHMPEAGTHSFQSLYQGWFKFSIPPPGGNFPLFFQNTFPGNDPDSKQLFACLVNGWMKNKDDNDYIGLLKAGGMLSLADNGLGLISWTMKAAEKMGVELGTYMSVILVNQAIISSMRRLLEFIQGNENQITWPWCRLFEETALFDYSTKRNKDAAALSALVVMGDVAALNQMLQFKDMDVHVRRYTKVASIVINHFAGMTSGVVGSEEARAIMMAVASMPDDPPPRLVNRPRSPPERPLTPVSSFSEEEEDEDQE